MPGQQQRAVERGQPAPEFTLRDQYGQEVALSGFRGEAPVLVLFYPFAFSRICSGELADLREGLDAFTERDVVPLAVSCDPVFALRAWSDAQRFGFALLSDFWPHGAAARSYGVFNESAGCALRGSFLVDRQGVVRWSVLGGMGEARDLEAHREALALL
ncbi:MAG: peroxiredoxin [Actinomycetes bacterium]